MVKRWLNQKQNPFKVRQKLSAADQSNAHDGELIMAYFESYKTVVNEYVLTGLLAGRFTRQSSKPAV